MSNSSSPSSTTIIGGWPPPPGVTPNFANPYSVAPQLEAAGIFIEVLSSVTMAIRLYTKAMIIKSHGWEDYTMLAAWSGFIAYLAVGQKAMPYGAGIHQWDVPLENVLVWAKWGVIVEIMYPVVIALTKLSICLQFICIFVPDTGSHSVRYWGILIFIWIEMSYFVANLFVTIFQCNPREKLWEPWIEGSCLQSQPLILVTAIFNCVSDSLMVLFPLFCIWNLRMSSTRKMGISAMFLVGTLAVAASILRLIYSAINNGSHDSTFTLTEVATCSVGEIGAGIVVGNLVFFPRFFDTITPTFTRLLSGSHSGHSGMAPTESKVMKTKSSKFWPKPTLREPFQPLPDQNASFKALASGKHIELRPSGSRSLLSHDGQR